MSTPKLPDSAVAEFFAECDEIVQRVSQTLQAIESGAREPDRIDALYRDVHTLKGSAFLFGFVQIGAVAHAVEASLDPIRKHTLAPPPAFIEITYKSLDLIERISRALREGQSEGDFKTEVDKLVPRLVEIVSREFGGEISAVKDSPIDMGSAPNPIKNAEEVRTPLEIAQVIQKTAPAQTVVVTLAPPEPATAVPSQTQSPATAPAATSTLEAENPTGLNVSGGADSSIRVQVALLDRLMNLVGELVLVRNQVLQFTNRYEDLEFANLSKAVDIVTSDLQGEVMRTRMQPIGNVLNKFQRVVRDLARDLGKKMDITLQGTETELDKTLIEAIKDPLTHIIRNACDHGIETIAERKAVGKPDNGHILVRAYHEGGQVVVEVADDGKGLNAQKLSSKAVEKGLLSSERAAKLTEREAFQLIFLPGFSTAKSVTAVSGRGVGMDVVKTNIEKIGGSVELSSILGKGTVIRLKIPLTLAIVPAVLVRSGQQRFAIPQIKLVELVRLDGEVDGERVEQLQGKPVFRLRGTLLPLVNLFEVMTGPSTKATNADAFVAVLNAENQVFGLMVDEILDTADIVVKPISNFLNEESVFSGATVMGDGSVLLILDVVGLAEKALIDTKKSRSDDLTMDPAKDRKVINSDAQEFLTFKLLSEVTHAIPLCLVNRLEEFDAAEIERSGDQWVVNYRGGIMPLIDLDHYLKYKTESLQPKDRLSVIVVQWRSRSFGFIVKDILDIVFVTDPIDDSIRDRKGVLGNIVVREEINVIIDGLGIIEGEVGRLQGVAPTPARSAIDELKTMQREYKNKKVRVLFADDVSFFRRQVAKVLTQEGFEVTTVEDGSQALKALEAANDGQFNVILSDIEMPNMNGFQLAREIRKQPRFKSIPLIALTTRFKERDIEEGRAAGFDLYLEKLNPERLLNGIETVMSKAANS